MLPPDLISRFEPFWPAETLSQRLARVAEERPDSIAIVDEGRSFTFSEMAELIERLAGHLSARGVRPGDVVSWQLPNWWEAVVVHHATLRLGAVSNPVNIAFRAREMAHVVSAARPKVLVVPAMFRGFDHAAMAASLSQDVLVARRGELDDLWAAPAAPAPAAPVDPSSHAVLLFTSGTTSVPKGVLHTHRALLCEVESFRDIHSLTPDDRALGGAPVAHIAGLVYGVMTPFVLGTSSVLLERWDPARATSAGATFMTGPPTFLLTLAQAAAAPIEGFRLFSTGGASIPTSSIRAAAETLGCVVKRAYGSTELPTLTATRIDDDERARLETDGRAIGGAEVEIRDGEIWGRAPEMFDGYLTGGALTPDGWFRTGDLGAIDDEGLLRVTGRLGDFIIRGGENISAKEIEDALMEHPAIADVAVVGIPDERLGERVCAYIVTRDGNDIALGAVTAFMRARNVATHKFPERVVTVEALPRTESGKVVKAHLVGD